MEIIHQKDQNRFILPLDNNLEAFVEYRLNDKTMSLIHSEVPSELRGKGAGKELVLKTFERLTEEGYKAVAICSYIKAIARRDEKWRKIINF